MTSCILQWTRPPQRLVLLGLLCRPTAWKCIEDLGTEEGGRSLHQYTATLQPRSWAIAPASSYLEFLGMCED